MLHFVMSVKYIALVCNYTQHKKASNHHANLPLLG